MSQTGVSPAGLASSSGKCFGRGSPISSQIRPNALLAADTAGPRNSIPVSRHGAWSAVPAHSWPMQKPPAKATSPSTTTNFR